MWFRTVPKNCRVLDLGFDVRLISPISSVEQFPRTRGKSDINSSLSFHVETVALLSQQQPDDIIEIDLNLDELDITTAELDVTYPKIKEYVLKKYGFKVSSLYIAQIKRKWGLKTRKNFNLSQKEKPVVPQCPSQKEEAITDALKYFGFI